MQEPQIEIQPGESLAEAARKVERAYEALGAALLDFENLNSHLPIASFCRFYQASFENREVVLVVMTGTWDDKTLLTVLNVLLEIRLEPDPPGRVPLFRLYSVEPVPPVLHTLFGDSRLCGFECRAVLVAHFGKELLPENSLQLAAVARHLLRENLSLETDFFHVGGLETLQGVVVDAFRGAGFSEDGAPLNALICLGFLYGEMLRARLPYPSRWARLRQQGPWPLVVFGAGDENESHVVFNAIATLISLYKDGKKGFLDEAAEDLSRRLEAEFETPTPRS